MRRLIVAVCVLAVVALASCILPGTASVRIVNRTSDTITQVYFQKEGSTDLSPKLYSTTTSGDILPDESRTLTGISPDTYDVWVETNGDFSGKWVESAGMVIEENHLYTITVR